MKTKKENALRAKLLQVCKNHKMSDSEIKKYDGTQVKYDKFPYAPYIPKNWNKTLVLAESQQLRGKNDGNSEYVKSLLKANDDDLIFRLGKESIIEEKPDVQLGVTPWDEGYIKLAMLSCFPKFKIDQFGVSNAVPWELHKDNKRQTAFLKDKSIEFWKELLPVLKPKYIVCTGEYADSIISDTCFCDDKKCLQLNIRSASQLGRVAYLFDENDLLKRYPEVKKAYKSFRRIVKIDKQDKRNYVFYAAHAVSKIKTAL
jgi:hypothetical protein